MSRDSSVDIPTAQRTLFRVVAPMDTRSALRWIVEKHCNWMDGDPLEHLIRDLDAYTSAKYNEGYEQGRTAAWSEL
jgi:hypothetical protein